MGHDLQDCDPTITPTDPTPTPDNGTFPLLPWINHDSKVTLWLSTTMSAPKQGVLKYTAETDAWAFSPGKQDKHDHIPLPRFKETLKAWLQTRNYSMDGATKR